MIDQRANLERPTSESQMERLALEQLHDEEALVVVATDIKQRADVRMTEAGNRLGLAVETRFGLRVADAAGGQDLDGDVPIEARVLRAIDLAHTAHADRGDNFIGTEAGAGRQTHGSAGRL